MSPHAVARSEPGRVFRVFRRRIDVESRGAVQFIDLTEQIRSIVLRSGIGDGLVGVQTRHTTTAVVVNEHEPLLLEDLTDRLRRWAPRDEGYRHDDPGRRTVNRVPGERPNGHAHARAFLLGASECLGVEGGRIDLGRWQRIFLVELDGPRSRSVSVTVLGSGALHAPGGNGRSEPLAPGPASRNAAYVVSAEARNGT